VTHTTALAALVLGIVLLAAVSPSLAVVTVHEGGTWSDGWLPELEGVRAQTTTIDVATGIRETIYQIPLRSHDEFEAIWRAVLSARSPGGTLTLYRTGSEAPEWPGVSNSGPAIRMFMPSGGWPYPPLHEETGLVPYDPPTQEFLHSLLKWSLTALLRTGQSNHGPPTQEFLNSLLEEGRALHADAPWPDSAYLPSGELSEYVASEDRGGRLTWVPAKLDADQRRFLYRARVDLDLVVDGQVVDLNRAYLPPDTSIVDKRDEPQPAPEGGQAAADEPSPDRSALLDAYGWGLAEDGLQLGLFHGGDRREFSYGDTLHLMLRARNTGDEQVELCFASSGSAYVRATPANRLTLDMIPEEQPQVLLLGPSEEKTVPGVEFRADLSGPCDTDRGAGTKEPRQSLALLPGLYTLECPDLPWLTDPTDANRHTAHQARPGVARFALLDDPTNPWVVERIVYDKAGSPLLRREMPGQPGAPVEERPAPSEIVCPPLPSQPAGSALEQPIAWGDFVNGLQGGLRLEETPALRAQRAVLEPPGEFVFGFYVRNCTNRRGCIGSAVDSDWWPQIKDSEGNEVKMAPRVLAPAEVVWVNHTLEPGQCVRLNSLPLQLVDLTVTNTLDMPVEVPKAFVESGRYSVSYTGYVSWSSVYILLPTGPVTFDVSADDLAREG